MNLKHVIQIRDTILTLVIIRFVDCDMMMHYHWCQGIGHTYCCDSTNSAGDSYPDTAIGPPEDDETESLETDVGRECQYDGVGGEAAEMEKFEAEYGMDERENEQLVESDEEHGALDMEQDLDDETLLQMDEMYYSQVL